MSETCLDCHGQFVLTSSERARFEALSGQLQGFKMPRRCARCRKVRRDSKPLGVQVPPMPTGPASNLDFKIKTLPFRPPPVVVVKPDEKPESPKAPIRMVLGTGDFEDLVSGKVVTWHGVQVVLADIGFPAMYDALDRAAVVRATAQVVQPRR